MVSRKRTPGQKNPVGKTQRDILRIIHSYEKGTDEPVLREKVKDTLNIRDKSDISKHLKKLETFQLIYGVTPPELRGKTGKKNIWCSKVYQKINNDFKDCGQPELTGVELELADFLVKFSNAFLDFLTSASLYKLIKNIAQLHELEKISSDYRKGMNQLRLKLSIPIPINEKPNFMGIAMSCLAIDTINGDIDINESNFKKEYKVILEKIVGSEEASRILEEDTKALNRVKSLGCSDRLNEIEI